MKNFFFTILYQPIFNLLIFLYAIIPGNDIGLAIIALTILIKLLLHPFSKKSLQSQKALAQLQPKVEALKEKYKDDKEGMSKALMELYKEEKVNPFSSCLPLLIQLPFLIAVFEVFRSGLANQNLDILYSFIPNPGMIDPHFLGYFNMAEPNIYLAILAGIGQFIQAKMLMTTRAPKQAGKGAKDENMMAAMNKQMIYFMPLITVFIGASLPSGLVLYWLTFTVSTSIQQLIVFRSKKKKDDDNHPPKVIEGEVS